MSEPTEYTAPKGTIAATIAQVEQLLLPAIKTWTLEEAAKKAAAVIAKIDVSALPFLATLALVKWEDIPDHLKPPRDGDGPDLPYAIRITTVCRMIDTPHNRRPQEIQSNIGLDLLKASEHDIERIALELLFHHMRHEIAELIKIDGVRKLNPHDPKSKYGAAINKYDHIFYYAAR